MNAELINPFIIGSQRVLESIDGKRPGLGKVYLKKPPHKPQQAAVTLNFIEAINCTVVYTMDTFVACYVASRMMRTPVTSLDFISQSALCELSNIISGHVATAFSQSNGVVDITTPEFFGNSYPDIQENMVCIPMILQNGKTFEIDICFPQT